jgi:hypothetical protein
METTSTLKSAATPAAIWAAADADAAAWPRWSQGLRRATLDGPLRTGAEARIVFRTGLRLRFRVVECEEGRLFTDVATLPGARIGHQHLLEPTAAGPSDQHDLHRRPACRDLAAGARPAGGAHPGGRAARRGRARYPFVAPGREFDPLVAAGQSPRFAQ